jgi:preprotein translocase subunit SecB
MTDEQATSEAGASGDRRFQIHKVYLKDVSFESPAAPGIFSADAELQPQIGFQINTETQRVGDAVYEVTLSATVSGEQDERTIFLVEVKQAGLFEIAGFSDDDRGRLLGAQCPSVLFPFAREVIADLVQKGALPQLVLQPINFEAVYEQQQNRQPPSGGGDQAQAGPA